ncbi:MAG: type II toxin-antitoxin system HicA family toxin [Treponema sp.]|nr:type II toxin-antitoxin system HicA family toxin [Treponema sp.]
MAGIEKLVRKMKNQPHGIILDEADRVLRHYGYSCKRMEGSHRQYINANGDVITIAAKGQLKKAYVMAILQRIGEG